MSKKLLTKLTTEIRRIHPDKAWVEQTRHELSFFASNNQAVSQHHIWRTPLWPTVLALTVVLLLIFPVQRVLAQSLPGDSLYPLKRLVEQTRIAMTLDSISKEKLKAHYAETRLVELRSLLTKHEDGENDEQLEYALNEVEKSFEETTGIADESTRQSLLQKALQVFTLLEEASLSGILQFRIDKLKTKLSEPTAAPSDIPEVYGVMEGDSSAEPMPSTISFPINPPFQPQETVQPTIKNETESKENATSPTEQPQPTSVPMPTDTSTAQPATPAPAQEEDLRKRIKEEKKRKREKAEQERNVIEES